MHDVADPHRNDIVPEEADLELLDEALVKYWSRRFGCSPSELFAVVGRVGRSVTRVRTEILRRQSIRRVAADGTSR